MAVSGTTMFGQLRSFLFLQWPKQYIHFYVFQKVHFLTTVIYKYCDLCFHLETEVDMLGRS